MLKSDVKQYITTTSTHVSRPQKTKPKNNIYAMANISHMGGQSHFIMWNSVTSLSENNVI